MPPLRSVIVAAAIWAGGVFLGFQGLALYETLNPDLRGWPQSEPPQRATLIEASRPSGRAFTLAECLEHSVRWDVPTPDEYAGTATRAVLTCRDRSGHLQSRALFVAAMLALLASYVAHARRRSGGRSHSA